MNRPSWRNQHDSFACICTVIMDWLRVHSFPQQTGCMLYVTFKAELHKIMVYFLLASCKCPGPCDVTQTSTSCTFPLQHIPVLVCNTTHFPLMYLVNISVGSLLRPVSRRWRECLVPRNAGICRWKHVRTVQRHAPLQKAQDRLLLSVSTECCAGTTSFWGQTAAWLLGKCREDPGRATGAMEACWSLELQMQPPRQQQRAIVSSSVLY